VDGDNFEEAEEYLLKMSIISDGLGKFAEENLSSDIGKLDD
jgi:hypothetical protein